MEDTISNIHPIIGVTVAIVGNVCISCALNIQKYVHNSLSDQPEQLTETGDGVQNTQSYLQSKLWWVGMALMIFGELGNFAAYGFAPPVLVAPLGTVALISNTIIAPMFLGERFRVQDFIGMLFSIAGTICILAVSTNTQEPTLTAGDIESLISQPLFICYFILNVIVVSILLQYSDTEIGKKYIFIDLLIASMFGGFTVLSVKAVSSLLNLYFYGLLQYWVSYLCIFITASTAVTQIHFLNKALSSFDSVEVIPTNFVLFTTFSIIGSSILYHDFSRTNPIVLLGVFSMFLGVYMITYKNVDDYKPVDDLEVGSEEWSRANDWNTDHNELWNPPLSPTRNQTIGVPSSPMVRPTSFYSSSPRATTPSSFFPLQVPSSPSKSTPRRNNRRSSLFANDTMTSEELYRNPSIESNVTNRLSNSLKLEVELHSLGS
ncbi:magnesium transporter NIPA-domain-containing protein [Globomyces pollinis-pini]|nr:magnesium transporter NIPA-domain-containing protein [Globomyces pollinis-pini]